jgi:hypothetical protein
MVTRENTESAEELFQFHVAVQRADRPIHINTAVLM